MPQDKDMLGCCAYAITFRCSLLQGEHSCQIADVILISKGRAKGGLQLQERQVSDLGRSNQEHEREKTTWYLLLLLFKKVLSKGEKILDLYSGLKVEK